MAGFAIVEAPYQLGTEGIGVGAGPSRLIAAGADHALGGAQVIHVRKRAAGAAGLDAVVDVNRGIRTAVEAALADGLLPVVLAGNCNSAIGTLAAIATPNPGIAWLDAHGDFNTPETTLTGSIEGMALAAAAGDCLDEFRERSGLLRPVDPANVVLLACRDLDPAERDRLDASPVAWLPADRLDDAGPLLEGLRSRAGAVYLHIDIDFAAPGGVEEERAEELVGQIVAAVPVTAVALANYNPALDPDGRLCALGLRLLRVISGV